MANNIGFGKIYDSTWWGNGVTDNSISWGIIYKDLAGSDSFVFSVKTDNAGSTLTNQFQLPLISASTVNAVVDWGDGSSDTITSYNQAETLHTYASSGEYTITMSGVINGWQFNNTGDRNKILDLQNFGTFELDSTTAELQFWGCNNLVISSSDDGNYENATNFFRTWQNCISLLSFPLIDTSSGINFGNAWASCSSLTSFPLIDVSSGTNFSYTWSGCNSLTSFPLIDTSSGTNFTRTWASCSSLTSFPLIDVSIGTIFYAAWESCSGLTSFPLLDVSSGTNFGYTWIGCSSLTSFPLLDVSNGTFFGNTWQNCTSLTSFPANMFDTCSATNFTNAFLNTNLSQTSIDNILVSIDAAGQSNGTFNQSGGQGHSYNSNAAVSSLIAKGWTLTLTTPVASPEFAFTVKTDNTGTSTDTQFTIPTSTSGITTPFLYDIETSDGQTITGLTGDHTITFPSAGEYDVKISGSFPFMYFNNGGDKDKLLDIKNFGVYALGSTSQSNSFYGCSNLVINATDVGNFGGVTDFFNAWRSCSSLTSFPLLDTSSGTTFYAAWFGCSILTSFPLIDTSNGTAFQYAWSGCNSLTSFPLIDTSSGTNFDRSWYNCNSLTSFPLIDTSSGTNFDRSWYNCNSLTSFPLIDTSSGTNFDYTWNYCSSLANFPANAFDTNIATNYSNAFLTTNLTTQSIDDILVSLDTSGVSNGTFTQSGGQAPSATGEAAIDSLVGKGWTITVTGGYTP